MRLNSSACRLWLVVASVLPRSELINAEEPPSFSHQVAAILYDNCVACHGLKKAEGGYRVDSFAEVLKPGDSGVAPIDAADPAASELVRRLTTTDENERMPAGGEPLGDEEIAIISQWVEGGASFDGISADQSLFDLMPAVDYAAPPPTYPTALPVSAIAFSPDGSAVLVSGYREVLVWNCEDATLLRRITNLGPRVYDVAFLSDDTTIAVACGEPGLRGEVRFFDYASGNLLHVLGRSRDVIVDLAVRPESQQIAAASEDGTIQIIDTASTKVVRTIASHADGVTAVTWNADGSRLASASRDKTVKVFDSNDGNLFATYAGHNAPARGISFATDGVSIISAGADNQLHRWNVSDSAKIAAIPVAGEAFEIIRSDNHLWVPSTDRHVRSVNLGDNSIVKTLAGHTDWITSLAVHESTQRLASGSMNGEIRLWNTDDGSLIRTWIAKP